MTAFHRRLNTILELFDATTPWAWTRQDTRAWDATFAIGDKHYDVSFRLNRDGDWEVSFRRGYRVGITGRGDAAQVIGLVLRIVRAFVAAVRPEALIFDANEPSRQRLYDRLLASSDLGGYQLSTDNRGGTGKYYRLERESVEQ